jgi:hypothetical protein
LIPNRCSPYLRFAPVLWMSFSGEGMQEKTLSHQLADYNLHSTVNFLTY